MLKNKVDAPIHGRFIRAFFINVERSSAPRRSRCSSSSVIFSAGMLLLHIGYAVVLSCVLQLCVAVADAQAQC